MDQCLQKTDYEEETWLKLGFEGWAGREKSCGFPPKGLVISAAVIHPEKQQPWVETKYLTGTLRIMPE